METIVVPAMVEVDRRDNGDSMGKIFFTLAGREGRAVCSVAEEVCITPWATLAIEDAEIPLLATNPLMALLRCRM